MRPFPASFPNVCLQSKLAKGSVVENHGRGLAGIRIEQPIRVGRPIEGKALGYQIRRINPADNIESGRSEEHTSDLQSLMRISSAVLCLKKTKTKQIINTNNKQKK